MTPPMPSATRYQVSATCSEWPELNRLGTYIDAKDPRLAALDLASQIQSQYYRDLPSYGNNVQLKVSVLRVGEFRAKFVVTLYNTRNAFAISNADEPEIAQISEPVIGERYETCLCLPDPLSTDSSGDCYCYLVKLAHGRELVAHFAASYWVNALTSERLYDVVEWEQLYA